MEITINKILIALIIIFGGIAWVKGKLKAYRKKKEEQLIDREYQEWRRHPSSRRPFKGEEKTGKPHVY